MLDKKTTAVHVRRLKRLPETQNFLSTLNYIGTKMVFFQAIGSNFVHF